MLGDKWDDTKSEACDMNKIWREKNALKNLYKENHI